MVIVVRGFGRIRTGLVLAVHLDLNDYASWFMECRKGGKEEMGESESNLRKV